MKSRVRRRVREIPSGDGLRVPTMATDRDATRSHQGRQPPYEYASLLGEHYLSGAPPAAAPVDDPRVPACPRRRPTDLSTARGSASQRVPAMALRAVVGEGPRSVSVLQSSIG